MDGMVRTALGTRIAVTVASLAAFVLLYLWAVTTAAGQQFDASSLALGHGLRERWGDESLARAADLAPWLLVVPAAVAIAVRALRGRWAAALAAGSLPVVAYVVATVLHDSLLPRPFLGEFGYEINTLPSERVAVAVACCCALVWCLPRAVPRAGLVVILGAAVGVVGALEVAAFSSRFADVVACAPLVAAFAVWWFPTGRPRGRVGTIVAGGLALVCAAIGAVLMVGWSTAEYAPEAMMPGLIGTALCVTAGVIATGLVLRTPAALDAPRHR